MGTPGAGFGAGLDLCNERVSSGQDCVTLEALQNGSSEEEFAINIDGNRDLYINSSGNVGINTQSPKARLEVNGTILGDFVDADNNTCKNNEVLQKSGSKWTCAVVSGGGGGLTGSGAANRAAFWTGATTLAADNNFWWDNTNKRLGLGTVAPAVTLQVVANGEVFRAGSASGNIIQAGTGAPVTGVIIGNSGLNIASGQNLIYGNVDTASAGNLLLLQNESVDRLKVTAGGDVVIAGKLQGNAVTVTSAGAGDAGKAPVLDPGGKLDASLLPFKQGALIAPADRPLISGLPSYNSDYFNLLQLDISGTSANQVCSGKFFGPNREIAGTRYCVNQQNELDNDTYISCDIPQGNDCNDTNPDAHPVVGAGNWFANENGTWLFCPVTGVTHPTGDFNCDGSTEKRTFVTQGDPPGPESEFSTFACVYNGNTCTKISILGESCGTIFNSPNGRTGIPRYYTAFRADSCGTQFRCDGTYIDQFRVECR